MEWIKRSEIWEKKGQKRVVRDCGFEKKTINTKANNMGKIKKSFSRFF